MSLGNIPSWHGGFPGHHEFSTLDGLDRDPLGNPDLELFFESAQSLSERWRGNQFTGLYLYGTPGTGKTHAAIGLGRLLAEQGAELHYNFSPNLSADGLQDVSGWTMPRGSKNILNNNVFPSAFDNGIVRNPRSVCIIDDHKPEKAKYLLAATEAAAQYGGLIIVTSKNPDPFGILEVSDGTLTRADIATQAILERIDPETAEKIKCTEASERADISASLRSRITSGFRFIPFMGEDRRPQDSFWN